MPYYLNVVLDHLTVAGAIGDGYQIELKWPTAYPTIRTNKILYNIYMSDHIAPDFPIFFFHKPPAFLSIDGTTKVNIIDLIPGTMYHFGVRAAEYDPDVFDPTTLPLVFNNLRILPESLLRYNIGSTDLLIPLVDAEQFPISGTVKIGAEMIYYYTVDYINNNLLVPAGTTFGAHLFNFGGGHFYEPSVGNVGTGTLNNLTLVSGSAVPETWIIKCVGFTNDTGISPLPPDHPIAGEAVFEAISLYSGSPPLPNPTLWYVYAGAPITSNGVLSFSIAETTTFALGDSFIVEVVGGSIMGGGRGYNNTVAEIHDVDGYDGYIFWNPHVIFWPIEIEAQNDTVYECWNRFDIHHYSYTTTDGYHQKTKDILTTNLTYSDDVNTGFPAYDYSGYHRTDPVQMLNGTCIGSYIGGQQGCADGYLGVGMQIRGLPIQDANLQRQEVLLSTTGEPVCLFKRRWTGITCKCMLPYNEYPEARCNYCLGGGIVISYEQFFNPRRSDGRIMVRFSPVIDDLMAMDSGLESTMQPDCWTICVTSLKDRDFIIRFDENNDEEFRYEILNVTRNKLLLNQTGVQKFVAQRIRKTDVLYMAKSFSNTEYMPTSIQTSISGSVGIPPHSHSIQTSEQITSVSQINQLTGVAAGHNHVVQNGVIIEVLGHTHTIVI
jgi:hypothetical protein